MPKPQGETPSLLSETVAAVREPVPVVAATRAVLGTVEAISHFKYAAELDSNFALAYLSLGRGYINVEQENQAFETMTKAFQLRDRASLRDRLDIEAVFLHLLRQERRQSEEGSGKIQLMLIYIRYN
jgi:hypothetical protein